MLPPDPLVGWGGDTILPPLALAAKTWHLGRLGLVGGAIASQIFPSRTAPLHFTKGRQIGNRPWAANRLDVPLIGASLRPPYVIGQAIFILPVGIFLPCCFFFFPLA